MEFRQLFPLGKAYGDAFCNRETETAALAGHLKNGKHTLLVAPRRYGKSSLAERAIEQTKLPYVKVNFHLCTSEAEIATIILDSVIKLIGTSIGTVEKLMRSIKKYLSNLEPLLSFGGDVASLKLVPKQDTNYAVVISESLLLLEKLLQEKGKRAVIFFDEFQEISHVSQNMGVEGAIRTAAQEMQCLSIIFSGSVRSLLLSMFEDEARPLYKLCRKIKLERISAGDYEKHIQKIAIDTWGAPLEQPVFDRLMTLSNRHPYYVNYLCDAVWEVTRVSPDIDAVEKAWKQVVAEEWSDAVKELADLPLGQRRLLKFIANIESKNIMSRESSAQLFMPISSISTAIKSMIDKDYVERHGNGSYEIINPLLLAVLRGVDD